MPTLRRSDPRFQLAWTTPRAERIALGRAGRRGGRGKLTDGIERVVGERRPGDGFGEVPITLGTEFQVGFRAAERSRVMRVEPHDYHAVAAAAPNVGREVGRLAAHRIGGAAGLQGIAAAL